MKLARIDHYRCGEPIDWRNGRGYTYIWVPDHYTPERLQEEVDRAREMYIATEQAFKKNTPPPAPSWGTVDVSKYPDTMSVAEIKADVAKREEAYRAYRDECDLARKPFAWHLKKVSGEQILEFHEFKPTQVAECDWGHNHGTTIEHSPTELADFPFDEKDEEDWA